MSEETREEALERVVNSFLHWHQRSVYDSREGRGSQEDDRTLNELAVEAQTVIDRDPSEFASAT